MLVGMEEELAAKSVRGQERQEMGGTENVKTISPERHEN